MKPFIPKDDFELPDHYGVTIKYHDKTSTTKEIAQHSLNKDFSIFEYVTKEDKWGWIPISSIKELEFDERFSKIMAIKEKSIKQKNRNG